MPSSSRSSGWAHQVERRYQTMPSRPTSWITPSTVGSRNGSTIGRSTIAEDSQRSLTRWPPSVSSVQTNGTTYQDDTTNAVTATPSRCSRYRPLAAEARQVSTSSTSSPAAA